MLQHKTHSKKPQAHHKKVKAHKKTTTHHLTTPSSALTHTIPRRAFTTTPVETTTTPPTDLKIDNASLANAAAKSKLTPEQRFQSRNAFMRRRHLDKDHLIHTHHKDVRLYAVNLTKTLQEAVKRHKMTRLEAEVWGGYALGTAAYAGLLRGNDRVIFEAFLEGAKKPTKKQPAEGEVAAEGEQQEGEEEEEEVNNHIYVEAFAAGEVRGFASITNPHVAEDGTTTTPGTGVVRLTKAIQANRRKYQSTIRATGDPMRDWQHLYDQSEQIPTYFQPEVILSEDDEGNVVVDFCGAALVQVLGGPAQPEEKAKALAEKKFARLEDEDDDQYAKRMQLLHFRNDIVMSPIPDGVQQYGATGYVSQLLGIHPDTLGKSKKFKNIGNVDDEFDFELFERALLTSALRDKPLANVINIETQQPATELDLQDGKHIADMEYRPLQFFCRCFQTPPQKKLSSLPLGLLETLVQDEEVTFTCDFCATDTRITQDMIEEAIAGQKQMKQQLQQQQQQLVNNHALDQQQLPQDEQPQQEQKQ